MGTLFPQGSVKPAVGPQGAFTTLFEFNVAQPVKAIAVNMNIDDVINFFMISS